jgi:hypothetical protein
VLPPWQILRLPVIEHGGGVFVVIVLEQLLVQVPFEIRTEYVPAPTVIH